MASNKKAAIVLMELPKEVAAQLFKELGVERSQAVELASQLQHLYETATHEDRARVLGEFLDQAAVMGNLPQGKYMAQTYAASRATLAQLARTSPAAVAATMRQVWLAAPERERRRSTRSSSRISPGWVLMGVGLAGVAAGLAGFPIALAGKPRKDRRQKNLAVNQERRSTNPTQPVQPSLRPLTPVPSEPPAVEEPPEVRALPALPAPAASAPSPIPLARIDPLSVEVSEVLYATLTPQINASYQHYRAILGRLKELGLVAPEIPVRKAASVPDTEYVIRLRNQEVARGRVEPTGRLALASSSVLGQLRSAAPDYSHGLPAAWISPHAVRRAEKLGCLVLNPAEVLAWHLNRVLNERGPELMETQEVYNLCQKAKQSDSGGRSIIHDLITIPELKAFLHKLWRLKGSIGDLGHLLKIIGDSEQRDPDALVQLVLSGNSVYSGPMVSESDIPTAAALAVLHRIHHWDINHVLEQLKPDEATELARGFVRVRGLAPDRVKSLWERLQSQRLYWTNQKRFIQWLQQFLRDGSRTEPALGPRRRLALLFTLLPVEVSETVSQLVLRRMPSARAKQIIAEVGKLTAYQLLEKPTDPAAAQVRERVAGEFLSGLKLQLLREELQMPGDLARVEAQRLAHSAPSACAAFAKAHWLGEKDAVSRFQEMARQNPRRTAMHLLALELDTPYLTGPEKAATFVQSLGPETGAEVERWLLAHGCSMPWAIPRPAYRQLVAQEFVSGFYCEGGARVHLQ